MKLLCGLMTGMGLICLFVGRCGHVCAAEPSVQATVPFEYLRNEMVAQVRIDGHGPYAMLLDTGTAPSIIDLNLARQIGLKMGATGHSGSGGGTQVNLSYETTLPQIEAGTLSAHNIAALALDLSGLSKTFGTPIQGVLGDSLFSGRVVQFDYPERVARFYAKSPFAIPAHGVDQARHSITLPFQHNSCVEISGVRVDGKLVSGNLDTGSNAEFQLTPRAVQRLGLQEAANRAIVHQQTGFNGKYESREGTVGSVQMGPFRVNLPNVVFWKVGTGHDDEPWDMNIGNEFLRDYVVTVDYQRDLVTLERP